jgi:DeoR/GlpR family transcriptional regulator of sugar metabolism
MHDSERWATAEERRELILAYLSGSDRASVIDLSQRLGVSEVTVRKDLDLLEGQGLLTRVHGGAVVSGRGRLELHFAAREQQRSDEKRRIAQAAASLIHAQQRIFLDASTSALQIARMIKDREDLVVITNGLYTALELTFSERITTVVIGGRTRMRSSSLVGLSSASLIERLNVDIGFFGASAVSARDGLMETDFDEGQLKQLMVGACGVVVGVVDSSKFGLTQLSAFALPREIDRIITDASAPPAIVAALREQDVLVDLV